MMNLQPGPSNPGPSIGPGNDDRDMIGFGKNDLDLKDPAVEMKKCDCRRRCKRKCKRKQLLDMDFHYTVETKITKPFPNWAPQATYRILKQVVTFTPVGRKKRKSEKKKAKRRAKKAKREAEREARKWAAKKKVYRPVRPVRDPVPEVNPKYRYEIIPQPNLMKLHLKKIPIVKEEPVDESHAQSQPITDPGVGHVKVQEQPIIIAQEQVDQSDSQQQQQQPTVIDLPK